MASLPRNVDVLIVGAGFSGLYQLHFLRQLGFNVKVLEAGGDIGGTWYWNCYPGARVDSYASMYQLSIDGVWQNWSFSSMYPARDEIQNYFHYISRTLELGRDIILNTRVVSAVYDDAASEWAVTTQRGDVVRCQFLSFCTGFASKAFTPALRGIGTFRGPCHHTALWPQEGIELRGKRVAVIGTGASGIQVIQEAAAVAQEVTVFQRTPSIALPMNQQLLNDEAKRKLKDGQAKAFDARRKSVSGLDMGPLGQKMADLDEGEKNELYEGLWAEGGFAPLVGGFAEVYQDDVANDWAYGFWRDKVRKRINDPWLQEKLAPTVKPYPLGAKRTPLEQNYYDLFNQPNVHLIDVNENDIDQITPKGIQTADGVAREFDVIVLATGFDAITGSMTQLDIRGTDGANIHDKWTSLASTYLGLMTADFPNMFFSYATHGPTALSNGPTSLEIQSDWIVKCIRYTRGRGFSSVRASKEAEERWTKLVNDIGDQGLWKRAKSWYTGANIPGKRVQHLNFSGGVGLYAQICQENEEKGYEGFEFSGKSK
ncbi:hypothetical protein PLEOSDRAFT_1114456 [Pleurotus ostreatus PC15]|uniref:FAD/NAD(P)-binding domain-containing protein n=1 Tax=Pleurotus ostreatus (strain PC15) TaxID=1137138 RepID=A0A067NHA1_PLEO1|nr:hypothetical protein PLEOSDRAFT_1114456 [Pleurotus ostreatus PC15]